MVMRPKSRATVVVVLRSTPVRSSTPSEASVISSSVRSGGISLTEPTMVVLPTPKPPAITILVALVGWSELAYAIENRLENMLAWWLGRGCDGRAEHDQSLVDQVREQDLHHLQRQVDLGGHLDHRGRELAGGDNAFVLGLDVDVGGPVHSDDKGNQVKTEGVRTGTSAGHRI